jgi:hypothetical protein
VTLPFGKLLSEAVGETEAWRKCRRIPLILTGCGPFCGVSGGSLGYNAFASTPTACGSPG